MQWMNLTTITLNQKQFKLQGEKNFNRIVKKLEKKKQPTQEEKKKADETT